MAKEKTDSTAELEILTPDDKFYSGEVEMLSIKLNSGFEGYMRGHIFCRKLLAEDGMALIREKDAPSGEAGLKKVKLQGGFVEIRDDVFTVYAEAAEYVD